MLVTVLPMSVWVGPWLQYSLRQSGWDPGYKNNTTVNKLAEQYKPDEWFTSRTNGPT